MAMTSRLRLVASSSVQSEEHTSELQSQSNLVCRLLLEKKKQQNAYKAPRPNYPAVHHPPHFLPRPATRRALAISCRPPSSPNPQHTLTYTPDALPCPRT